MTLMGLGAFALVLSVVIRVLNVDLHFIDPRAMAFFSAAFVAVGAWMVRHGHSLDV